MIIDIGKIKREMVFPILLQSVSSGILTSTLFSKITPIMDSSSLIIIERILGIGYKISYGTLNEVFIKVSLFVVIQFIALSFLFQISAQILCKFDISFLDVAFIVSKPLIISAIILICGLPWLLVTPLAALPFLLASFIVTLVYNHTVICSTFNLNINKGVFLTTSVYLIYFTFIFICIIKT